jgi:hypothetical protein
MEVMLFEIEDKIIVGKVSEDKIGTEQILSIAKNAVNYSLEVRRVEPNTGKYFLL